MNAKIISCMMLFLAVILPLAQGAGQYVQKDVRLAPKLLNYQGYLTDAQGNPVTNPSVSMIFAIFDAASAGSQKWTETQGTVAIDKGIFNVLLGSVTPIPDSVFTSSTSRYLQLTVAGQVLSPRTRIVAAGYAYTSTYSDTAQYARVSVPDNDWTRSGGKIYTFNTADSVGVRTTIPRYSLDINGVICGGTSDTVNAVYGGVLSGYSNLAGDVAADTAATVTGGYDNHATGKHASVGGGRLNRASGIYATVSGGNDNIAGITLATIGGGGYNRANGNSATVGGGSSNVASGYVATVAGGSTDTASGSYATVGGGNNNTASGDYAKVGGGYVNTTNMKYSAVLGGYSNLAGGDSASDSAATVCAGYNNSAMALCAFVGGGQNNLASGRYATVGGGRGDTASDFCATVAGGESNIASYNLSTVGGGGGNSAIAYRATVAGGYCNTASGTTSTIAGGHFNVAESLYASIGGGYFNSARDSCATVGGGRDNSASGRYSTVGGGCRDTTYGRYGFATNYHAAAEHDFSSAFTTSHTIASMQVRAAAFSTGSVDYAMDHPDDPMNKILNQYGVSSNEVMSVYSGVVTLDGNGRASVSLPDYFDDINRNPRIQLTGVGSSDVYVAEKVKDNRFVVGGKPGIEVYWEVTGERKDIQAEIARIQTPVMQDKQGKLRGHSIDDDAMIGIYDGLHAKNPELFQFKTEEGRGVHEQSKKLVDNK